MLINNEMHCLFCCCCVEGVSDLEGGGGGALSGLCFFLLPKVGGKYMLCVAYSISDSIQVRGFCALACRVKA